MHTFTVTVLFISIVLQLTAAALALRLVRKSAEGWHAWLLIAAALTLMAARRVVTLVSHFAPSVEAMARGPAAESIALVISALMVGGVLLIPRVFQALQQTTADLQAGLKRLHASEEVLRESESKFRGLAEKSLVGVYVIQEGVFKYANPRLAEIFGYAVDELIEKKGPRDLVLSEDWPIVEKNLQKRLSGEVESIHYEFRGITKDNETVDIEVYGSRTLYQGRPAVIGTLLDTTERKRAEQERAWEAGVNAAMAELSKALISRMSIEDISCRVLEHARLLTRSTYGYVGYIDPKTGYLVCPTMTREVWETCQVPDKDIVFKKIGGLLGWVLEKRKPLLTNTPSVDPRSSGLPQGHIPIHRFLSVPALMGDTLEGQVSLANADRDYTERDLALAQRLAALYAIALQRQWAEETLRESEEKYRAIFSEAQDGIVLIEKESGRIVDCNPAFESQTGRKREHLRKMKIWETRPVEKGEAARKKFIEVKEHGAGGSSRLEFQKPDGRIVPIEFLSRAVKLQGREYLQSVTRDITKRKLAEEAMHQQLEELERFRKVTIQREFRMKALKDRLRELEMQVAGLKSESKG